MRTADGSRPLVVFDVLGTLVDQAGSMRRQTQVATGWSERRAGDLVTEWLEHVAAQERRIVAGEASRSPPATTWTPWRWLTSWRTARFPVV